MHKQKRKIFNLISCLVLMSGAGVSTGLAIAYANPANPTLSNQTMGWQVSKTQGYKVIHNKVNIDNSIININPMNLTDQNKLKQIALNEVLSNKTDSPFELSYYYDDKSASETYVGINRQIILKSLEGLMSALKGAIRNVFVNNLRFTGAVMGQTLGVADYHLTVGGAQANRVSHKWDAYSTDTAREFYINDMTPFEVEALGIFENQKVNNSSPTISVHSTSKCCSINSVTDNKTVTLNNELLFAFDVTKSTLDWYHKEHGLWFGKAGEECSVVRGSSKNIMLFKTSAAPSYFINEKTSERFDLTNLNNSPEKIQAMHDFILEIAANEVMETYKQFLDNNELTFILTMMKQTMSNVLGSKPFFEQKLKGLDLNENAATKFASFLQSIDSEIDVISGWENLLDEYRWQLVSNVSVHTVPVITYNKRPLYRINLYENLSSSEIQTIQTSLKQSFSKPFSNLTFSRILLFIYNQVSNSVSPAQLLDNVSQNVELNTNYSPSGQALLFKQNQVSDFWINDLTNFSPIDLPWATVQNIGNLITNLSPDKMNEYYLNNMLYYYHQNGNLINAEVLAEIPILYGLNGLLEAYISGYLSSNFDTNQSLSQNIELYVDEEAFSKAKIDGLS